MFKSTLTKVAQKTALSPKRKGLKTVNTFKLELC